MQAHGKTQPICKTSHDLQCIHAPMHCNTARQPLTLTLPNGLPSSRAIRNAFRWGR